MTRRKSEEKVLVVRPGGSLSSLLRHPMSAVRNVEPLETSTEIPPEEPKPQNKDDSVRDKVVLPHGSHLGHLHATPSSPVALRDGPESPMSPRTDIFRNGIADTNFHHYSSSAFHSNPLPEIHGQVRSHPVTTGQQRAKGREQDAAHSI